MKKLCFMWLLGLGVWLSGCSASHVVVDKAPEANLSNYRTFQFTDADSRNEGTENSKYHSLIDRSIHAYIARELESRGLTEVDENADMLVAYHTYTEKKRSSYNDFYPMMYGGWYWRFYPWGIAPFPYTTRRTYTYTEGTLIVDIIDARSNELVWRGAIDGTVDSPASLIRQAEKAVKAIFKEYPVAPRSVNRQNEVTSRR